MDKDVQQLRKNIISKQLIKPLETPDKKCNISPA